MNWLLSVAAVLATSSLCAQEAADAGAAGTRPNVILVLTDDISWDDLGCYGHPTIHTPNLDRMATEGLRFTQAYLTASSCSPSRCSLITSRYPHNTGAPELHTTLPKDQFQFPKALRDAGYYTVLSGKNHMGGAVRTSFEVISRGKGPGRQRDWVPLLRDRPKDRPFFFWFASTDAHRTWQKNDKAKTYELEDVRVPPFLADGPQTRQDLADYYHEVSRTDAFVGDLIAEIQRQKIERDTIVIYMSDNGRPFPRCKTRLYDSGIKTPLLVWGPGRVKAGAVCDRLVSTIDLGPTILDLAGVQTDERMQGRSAVALLGNPSAEHCKVVFAEHNWHVFAAHQRMVRFGDWLFIRNAWPDRPAMCVESAPKFPAGAELWEWERNGMLGRHQRDVFLNSRPAEELYRVSSDPHQLTNLAATAQHDDVLAKARGLLERWTLETGDTVPEKHTPDREDERGVRVPGFSRGTMPGTKTKASKIVAPGPR